MQISVIEAVKKKMVTDRNDVALNEAEFLGKSSIDLSIRSVLTRTNTGTPVKSGRFDINGVSISQHSTIQPQETVYLVSEERINVPPGYVAYVFLKNQFSQIGLLAFNTGIVDGGYNGPIATLLTNISAESIELESVNKGKFFRVVFHAIDMNQEDKDAVKTRIYHYEDYLALKAKDLKRLPRFFQNPDRIKEQIEGSLNEKALNFGVMRLGAIIGMAGLLMVLAPPLTELVTKSLFSSQPLNKELWENQNQSIEKRIHALENEMQKLTSKPNQKSQQGLTGKKIDDTQ